MHTKTSTLNVKLTFIVGTLPPPLMQEGGLSLQPNFQNGGLTGHLFVGGGGGWYPSAHYDICGCVRRNAWC